MSSSWRFGVTLLLLCGALAASRLNGLRESQPMAHPLATIAEQVGECQSSDDAPLPERIATSLSATSYLSRSYRCGARQMNLFIAFYANQRAGESMHSPKYCMPGGGWELMDSGRVTVSLHGQQHEVNNYVLYRGGERLRMLYWYQGRGRVVASEYKAKVYLLWDAVRSGQTAGSIVRITTPDGAGALERAKDLAAEMIRQVQWCFGAADPIPNFRQTQKIGTRVPDFRGTGQRPQ
jgi:EpsI family protein